MPKFIILVLILIKDGLYLMLQSAITKSSSNGKSLGLRGFIDLVFDLKLNCEIKNYNIVLSRVTRYV